MKDILFLTLHLVAVFTVSANIFAQNPECKFEASPNPVAIGQGTTFTCKCFPPANQTFIYQLIKDPTTGEDEWGPFVVEENFVIPKVETSMLGLYECWSKFTYQESFPSNSITTQTTLKPITQPTGVTVDVEPEVVDEDQQFTVTCTQTGGDPATSYIFSNIKGVSITSESSVLIVPKAKDALHEGDWKCSAVNPAGTTHSSNAEFLDVVVRPTTVTITVKPTVIKECETMILEATLDKPATVQKYVFQNLDTGVEVTVNDGTNKVTIKDVTKTQHQGNWAVTVHGEFGTLSSLPVAVFIKDSTHEFTVGCDERKYVFNKCRMTQPKASAWCKKRGMDLAVLGDMQELNKVCDAILKYDPSMYEDYYWVGLSREGHVGTWMNDICQKPALFTRQITKESGNCLGVHNDKMVPTDCEEKYPFVCVEATCDIVTRVPYAGDTYVVVKRPRTRKEAGWYCWSIGMELFSINALPEMQGVCNALLELGLSSTPFWTGPKYDKGKLQWIDTCKVPIPVTVMPILQVGQYQNYEGERCTVLQNDLYYVRPCEECRGFICEDTCEV